MATRDDEQGMDRRGFLECMAWVGTGAVWTMASGVLKGTPLEASADGAAKMAGGLRFVQISDSHIGFDKPANTDVTATLREAIAKIKGSPEQPSFVLHTGDLTHLSKPSEFDTLQQLIDRAEPVHRAPALFSPLSLRPSMPSASRPWPSALPIVIHHLRPSPTTSNAS